MSPWSDNAIPRLSTLQPGRLATQVFELSSSCAQMTGLDMSTIRRPPPYIQSKRALYNLTYAQT
ncbi:predicted protein [Sclerotinia sclerotiorum 1980 UF-70]|uniref:Uncharacterized protein n=1 Tax=Sclerotinia sclerotiorum (strain ATCC 18683 / 1980 / Ss-1) TaxID=665079 RepID=A7EPK5_SCLS1|nr:predicted protein [Sclerotinia sclerotiorum 1980 UF-70]EDO04771.1 predicted protein [Sclerotinia sclerotiorum 1980 UF-70]